VAGVAGLLRLLEVTVLGVDDVVGGLTTVLEVARTSQLSTGHGLHGGALLSGFGYTCMTFDACRM
jgi:hypothetical protein